MKRPRPGLLRKIAVIGGGWAGCAAAVELARHGHQVALFERARTLGGRARAVEFNGRILDNGQHILLGAYTDTLRLLQTVGIHPKSAFLHLPLQMRYPPHAGGMDFIAPRLPAPWHLLLALLFATGLHREDKMALARFSTTARWMGWQLHQDCSVAELLERFDQTERLTQLMWRPLCIAALNTAPEQASAQVFLNVLRDSLGARRSASDMLIPRLDLSKLFPQSAATYIEQAGGKVYTGCAIQGIRKDATGWALLAQEAQNADLANFGAVILATQAEHANAMLRTIPGAMVMPALEYEPITTCYLQYAPELKLAQPFFALVDNPACDKWGQFVFDRGQLMPEQAGLLAVVTSTSAAAIESGHEVLAKAIASQLAECLQLPALAQPAWTKVISEKRATFRCTPGLTRPSASTGVPGLVLAGDYIDNPYPATLESAVQSGIQAARMVAG